MLRIIKYTMKKMWKLFEHLIENVTDTTPMLTMPENKVLHWTYKSLDFIPCFMWYLVS